MATDPLLASLDPVALGGGPAAAYASHAARATGIARYYALTNPLPSAAEQAGEDNAMHIVACRSASS